MGTLWNTGATLGPVALLMHGAIAQAQLDVAGATTRPEHEVARLVAADARLGDSFGRNVAIHDATVVVGSQYDDDVGPNSGDWFGNWVSVSGDTTVIGVYNDGDAGFVSGSAHVFRRARAGWLHEAKLTASDAQAYDHFGVSVSISGERALIGAHRSGGTPPQPGPGAAFVFERGPSGWNETARLSAPDGVDGDAFGCSVSIWGDRAVVGARLQDSLTQEAGVAHLFERTVTGWTATERFTASDAAACRRFGGCVSLGSGFGIVGVGDGVPDPAVYVIDP